ncbi:type VII secretion-associated serine protease mycosin [Streptomonospora sediminis]
MRGNRAAPRAAWAAACAVALLVPLTLPAAAPAAAETADGRELRPEQWGMDAIGAAKTAERSSGDGGGGVLVAVLGGGVDTSHPDLGEGTTAGDDFTEGAGSGGSATPLAGIIAGRGHGREYTGGIVGVAPGADLLSVRVLPGDTGGGASGAAAGAGQSGAPAAADAVSDGIRYAVAEGAQIITLPQGAASAEPDDGVQAAIGHAGRNGVLVVAPAGAGGSAYPGAYTGVTAVGAVGEDRALTPGSPATEVALTAPGAGIRAPAAGGGYTTVDGTAAAAAFVAGAAALVRAEHPQLRPGEVADTLTSGARPGAAGEGAAGYGAGVLDVQRALEQGAAATEGAPLIDEDLAAAADEDPALPGWAVWTGCAVLGAAVVAALVLLWRRATANPYGLDSRASGKPKRARGTAAQGSPGRSQEAARQGRTRPGKPEGRGRPGGSGESAQDRGAEPAGAGGSRGGPDGRRRGGRRRR